MNLIYICVFYQESYINLLQLLISSMTMYSNLNKENTHILIITSILFKSKIEKELIPFDLPINYFILDLHTLMDASCCKLNIFQYILL